MAAALLLRIIVHYNSKKIVLKYNNCEKIINDKSRAKYYAILCTNFKNIGHQEERFVSLKSVLIPYKMNQ